MRLQDIKKGKEFTLKHRIMRVMMNVIVEGGAPDVILTLMYRREFLGKHLSLLFHEVMRHESELSILQRELVATATSKANDCPFCTTSHAMTATLASDEQANHLIPPTELREQTSSENQLLMDFATKMTKNEEDISQKDIDILVEAGFSMSSITDTMHIVFGFCIINRLANAFDFELPSNKGLRFSAKMLLNKGYKF